LRISKKIRSEDAEEKSEDKWIRKERKKMGI